MVCPNQTKFPHENGHRVKFNHDTGATRCLDCNLEAIESGIMEEGINSGR